MPDVLAVRAEKIIQELCVFKYPMYRIIGIDLDIVMVINFVQKILVGPSAKFGGVGVGASTAPRLIHGVARQRQEQTAVFLTVFIKVHHVK